MKLLQKIKTFCASLNASNLNDSRYDYLDLDDINIDEDEFTASVSNADGEWIEIEGGVREEDEESLWGDQVASIHRMAYAQADEIENIFQFDADGKKLPYVELRFVDLAKPIVDEEEFELEKHECRVDTSLQYHDLI